MTDILSRPHQEAIRRAALEALASAEAAYCPGNALHHIRALGKNSFSTIYRSFLETYLSGIAITCDFIDAAYSYYILHFPEVNLQVCSVNDLYGPIKNDRYDDYPLFREAGLAMHTEAQTGKPHGFLVFSLYNRQLLELSIVSRRGEFNSLQLYKKMRNDVIIDSLSMMRDKSEKKADFVLKTTDIACNEDER